MPICQNCKEKWTWKQTMKTLFRLKCPSCGVKQYESAKSRVKTSMLGYLPVIIVPFLVFTNISLFVPIVILIAYFVVLFCLYPFMIQLSNEQEPFW